MKCRRHIRLAKFGQMTIVQPSHPQAVRAIPRLRYAASPAVEFRRTTSCSNTTQSNEYPVCPRLRRPWRMVYIMANEPLLELLALYPVSSVSSSYANALFCIDEPQDLKNPLKKILNEHHGLLSTFQTSGRALLRSLMRCEGHHSHSR